MNENQTIDLFWKAREFKTTEKSVDWYWVFWILTLSLVSILLYFYEDKIFAMLIFLIAVIVTFSHGKAPGILEHKINNEGILINNGKKEILFSDIKSFNIDLDDGYILINTKNKYEKLIRIPFEANHNITVIKKILSSKVKQDLELNTPFLEKLLERMLGF